MIRKDTEENFFGLEYLKIKDKIIFKKCDLLNLFEIISIFEEFKPAEIYNLATQSSVGLSFENPHEAINFNILSVLNITPDA